MVGLHQKPVLLHQQRSKSTYKTYIYTLKTYFTTSLYVVKALTRRIFIHRRPSKRSTGRTKTLFIRSSRTKKNIPTSITPVGIFNYNLN